MSRPDEMRVLIVRLGALGDVVHTIPVAAALARRLPGATVDWVIDERSAALLDLVPDLDRRIVLRARGRTLAGWRALGRTLRQVRYDAALDVQGLGKSALVARFSGARRIIGFPAPLLREGWARWLHTETADMDRRGRHVVDRNLGILGALGIAESEWRFPLRLRAAPAVDALRRRVDPAGAGFAVINPDAAWSTKRWPPERYGAVAAHVARAHGRPSVVIRGPGDASRAAAVVVAASDGAAALAPPTDLAELAALLGAAALLVSGDTGPLHLAAALGTPVVGLYGPSDPARNGPWSADDEVVSAFSDCACAARRAAAGREVHMVRRCRARTRCLDAIAVDRVCAAVDRRLGKAAARHA